MVSLEMVHNGRFGIDQRCPLSKVKLTSYSAFQQRNLMTVPTD